MGAAGDDLGGIMWKADLGGPLSFSASDVGSHWSILRSYDTIPARLLLKIDYRGRGQETSWKLRSQKHSKYTRFLPGTLGRAHHAKCPDEQELNTLRGETEAERARA